VFRHGQVLCELVRVVELFPQGWHPEFGPWETIAMPVLTATVFNDQTKRPIAWKCSACETVFALDRVDAVLTKKSTEQINKDFEMHCNGQHPGSQVVGLNIPREDF
jgi:hypothetical protein